MPIYMHTYYDNLSRLLEDKTLTESKISKVYRLINQKNKALKDRLDLDGCPEFPAPECAKRACIKRFQTITREYADLSIILHSENECIVIRNGIHYNPLDSLNDTYEALIQLEECHQQAIYA